MATQPRPEITPKVLFAADGYRYAGKTLDCMPTVRAVKQQIASIERVVLVPYANAQPALDTIDGATPHDHAPGAA